MASEVVSSSFVGSAGLVVSVVLHALTFLVLGTFEAPDVFLRRDDTVELTVMDEPEIQEPEPAALPEPEPVKSVPVKPVPKIVEPLPKDVPPPPPEPEPPAAAAETLADFSGTTLVGEGEGGWASAVGSGAAMDKPIGKAGAVVTGRDRAGVAGGVVGGTGVKVVAEANLSRKPGQPAQELLDDALVRSYPKAARQQGIEGVARIRIRVLASGKVQTLATLSETYPGFGDACRSSVRDLRFAPGLDQQGQPVATEVPYSCEFRVE